MSLQRGIFGEQDRGSRGIRGLLAVLLSALLVVTGAQPAFAEDLVEGGEGAAEQTEAAEQVAAPVLHWKAVGADGAPVVGVTFELQSSPEAPTVLVEDYVEGQTDYVGLDSDPAAGSFKVAALDEATPVLDGGTYRVRPAVADQFLVGEDAEWTDLTGTVEDDTVEPTLSEVTLQIPEVQQEEVPEEKQQKAEVAARGGAEAFATPINPTASTTVVRVNKQVLRDSSAYLEGATFRLELGGSGGPNGMQVPNTTTCTIAVDDDWCEIVVPDTNVPTNQGGNQNRQVWAVEMDPEAASPAAGTYRIPQIAVGSGGDVTSALYYPGRTPQLVANQTVDMPQTGSGTSTSIGKTVNAIKNPPVAPSCDAGLDIVLVLDKSGSIAVGDRDDYADGLRTLVGSLTGTGSRMSVVTFNTTATIQRTLSPVDNDLADYLDDLVDTNDGYANATNWDDGFTKANDLANSGAYDFVIFVTDGAPNQNRDGENGTPGSPRNPVIRSLENGVLSANELKSKNIPVLAVGVGNALEDPNGYAKMNLAAVSGVENIDFFIGAWAQLGTKLQGIANSVTCRVPVEVIKKVADASGQNPTPDAGWNMTVGMTPDPAGSAVLDPATATRPTAGDEGRVEWLVDFNTLDASAAVTVSEDAASKPGYDFHSLTCTITRSNGSVENVAITGQSALIPGVLPTDRGVSCTFTNKLKPPNGALQIVKAFDATVPDSAATQVFSGTYTCTVTGQEEPVLEGIWSRTGTGVAVLDPVADNLPPGAECTAEETSPAVGSSTGLPNTSWVWGTPDRTDDVEIESGETATITFTNKATRVYANFQVRKLVPIGSTADLANLYSGEWQCVLGDEEVSGEWGPIGVNGIWTSTAADAIPLGATCSVTSEDRPEWPVAGDHSYVWDGDPVFGDPVPAKSAAPLNIVDVTNATTRQYGSLTVTKVTEGTPDDFSGTFGGEWSCTYGGNGTLGGTWSVAVEDGDVGPTTYGGSGDRTQIPLHAMCTVTETPPSDDQFEQYPGYTWESSVVSPSGPTEIVSTETPVAFTVTNTAQQTQLTLVKEVENNHGGTLEPGDWDGKLLAGDLDPFDSGETRGVAAGDYALSEDDVPGYEPGDPALECDVEGALDGDTVTVAVGTHATCTFKNVDIAPTLTLVKHVDNKGGVGNSDADEWELTADGPTDWDPETTQLEQGNSATTATQDVTAGEPYTLGEDGPEGYDAGAWECNVEGALDGDEVTLELGDNVTCEITNTAEDATWEHDKTLDSVEQGSDGIWEIVYKVTVENTHGYSNLIYDLDDTLRFGEGITVDSASWTGPDYPGDPADSGTFSGTSAVSATDRLLGPDGTHVYTVTVSASIAEFPTEGDTWQDCELDEGENGTGFLNESALTVGDETDEKEACGEPNFVSVEKTGIGAVQDPETGEWTVTYEIDVATTTTGDEEFDLAVQAVVEDEFPGLPTGWALKDGLWNVSSADLDPPFSEDFTPVDPRAPQELWSGTMPADTTYTFTVIGVLVPSATAGPIGECDPETGTGGLVNTAYVWSGEASESDPGCVDVPLPEVDIVKTVTDTFQNPDGSWTITYDIEVTNEDENELTAIYTLTDTLEFGAGITPTAASWTGPAEDDPVPSGTWTDPVADNLTTTLATDRALTAATGTHTYTVTVEATIAPEAWQPVEGGPAPVECYTGEEREAGGFLNVATVVSGGETLDDDACETPARPTVEKTGAGATQDPDDPDGWFVSYYLTVDAAEFDSYYTLSDTPGFSSGITLDPAGTAQRLDGEGNPIGDPIDIAPGGVFPDEEVPIEADGQHVWLVTWYATVDGGGSPAVPECGVVPEAGEAFYNAVTLWQGEEEVDHGDACIPVADRVYPQVDKTVTSTKGDPSTGKYTVTYDIDVNLAAKGPANPDGLSAKYDLEDELRFGSGITVESAKWSGETSGTFSGTSATLATGKSITAGSTHTYTVTVVAQVANSAFTSGSYVCTAGSDGKAGGFLNVAELTSGGQVTTAQDCSQPTPPKKPTIPVTGGSSPVPFLIGGAALLILGGGALVLALRRRRGADKNLVG